MSLPMPKIQIDKSVTQSELNIVGATAKILDQTAYTDFSTRVIRDKIVEWQISAKPELNVGKLKYPVDFQKTVQVAGLDGLRGITLSKLTFLSDPLPDGTNMISDGKIPNPSNFTIEIGNVTTSISLNSLPLGTTKIQNLVLQPGENRIPFHTTLNPTFTLSPQMTKQALALPNLNITITFKSIVYNGNHVDWLEKPMAQLSPFFALMNPKPGVTTNSNVQNKLANFFSKMIGQATQPGNAVGELVKEFSKVMDPLIKATA
ncbi:hypothetical protein AA313_de0209794 [Arthrobotrys entomopaga]|nr:hypothetical protein AA313_de0209794 [Arthrobotrys entomopaga]